MCFPYYKGIFIPHLARYRSNSAVVKHCLQFSSLISLIYTDIPHDTTITDAVSNWKPDGING